MFATRGTPLSAGGIRWSSARVLGASDKQNIRAGIAIAHGARDRAIEAFDGDGVGAGNHQSFAGMTRVERRLDLADHFGGRDQHLVVQMAAALREILVLDLDGIGAGALEQADGPFDIEGIAVAGVGIDDQDERARGRGSA